MHLVNAEPHPLLQSGEKVIIRNGPLQGVTGIVSRHKNRTRVILTLDLIMKSVAVEVRFGFPESIGASALQTILRLKNMAAL